jgi:MYXO-CTERM domain-containing protein
MVGAALDIGAFEYGSGPPIMPPDGGVRPDGGVSPDGGPALPDGAAGGPDGATTDAGDDGGPGADDEGGCGCRLAPPATDGSTAPLTLVALLVLIAHHRRRR